MPTTDPKIAASQPVGTGDLLAGLHAKFPKHKFSYAPTPDCRKCNGSGLNPPRTLPSGTKMGETLCICVYLGPNTKLVAPLLAQAARRALADLSSANK